MAQLGSRIVVHAEGFQHQGWSDQNSLVNAQMDKVDSLTPALTFLMGSWSKRFPLLTLTEGQAGNAKAEEINNVQYEYPIIGKRKGTETVAESTYSTSDAIGVGRADIFLPFNSNWFPEGATIASQSGTLCRVSGYEKKGASYMYRLQKVDPSYTATLPYTDTVGGAIWGRIGGTTVTESLSVGNTNPTQTPGKRKNQISILRESYRLAGNISNKTVEFQLFDGQKTTNLWLPYEEFQHRLAFKEYTEMHLWTSEYTRAADGSNPLIDERLGQIIPIGAGLKQQIPNIDTYSKLSIKKLRTIMNDVFIGAEDADNGIMDIILYTGVGGEQEFDEACKNDPSFKLVAQGTGDKFVSSMGGGLRLGGYFKSYQHTDGRVVTVQSLPFLNTGAYADISGRHPETGLPLSSYEMYFIDQSKYGGMPNLRYIHQKGRMEIRGVHQGMNLLKGSDFGDYKGNTLNLGTEQDLTSLHMLKTCGIQLMRDTHSFRLSCISN